MDKITFSSRLDQYKDGTWWFVHVPKNIRDGYKQYEKRGIIHVRVRIGTSSWDGSMLPWADGSAQISIPKRIRSKENVSLSQMLEIFIQPR